MLQNFLALGTSRGFTQIFDAKQQWKFTLSVPAHAQYGAVSALAMSPDGIRLLVGHERGQVWLYTTCYSTVCCSHYHDAHSQIVRWDLTTGKVCNTMTDIFPQSAMRPAVLTAQARPCCASRSSTGAATPSATTPWCPAARR